MAKRHYLCSVNNNNNIITNDMEKIEMRVERRVWSGKTQVNCFSTQENTEIFAQQTGGDVVLLRRKDGNQMFECLGNISLPYVFGIEDMGYTDDDYAIGVHSLAELGEEIENTKRLFEGIEELEDARVGVSSEAVDAVLSLQAGDMACLVWDGYRMKFLLDNVFRAYETSWRNAGCWEYRIGVAPSAEV